MRARSIIQRQFEADLETVHAARVRLVFAAVWSLLRSGKLSLTSLGRAIAESTSPKHGIKRIDRLLGNSRLHAERLTFYRAVARRLIRPGTRPVILVDWTGITGELWALVAAVCYEGRAFIIYAETHPISRYMKPAVNVMFLNQLASILPERCVPIIVTDAGFRSPWWKLIMSLDWDYVGRLRAPAKVRRDRGEAFVHIENLWPLARFRPLNIGWFQIGRKLRYPSRLVAVRKKRYTIFIPERRDGGPERHRRVAHEPWILATSLDWPPEKIAAIYQRRMQIEETFRDAKSSRYGLSLMHARTNSESRADILLLLLAIANLVYALVGIAAEHAKLHRQFQANTVKSRRVLSLVRLGRLVIERARDDLVEQALGLAAWASLLHHIDRSNAL